MGERRASCARPEWTCGGGATSPPAPAAPLGANGLQEGQSRPPASETKTNGPLAGSPSALASRLSQNSALDLSQTQAQPVVSVGQLRRASLVWSRLSGRLIGHESGPRGVIARGDNAAPTRLSGRSAIGLRERLPRPMGRRRKPSRLATRELARPASFPGAEHKAELPPIN